MNDIADLHAAEIEQKKDHHWKIAFEVIIEGEDQDWAFDEKVVAAGPDSQKAVDILREHVLNELEYGQKILGLRMMDIKLLSVAEL
jgi:hypothetical protein